MRPVWRPFGTIAIVYDARALASIALMALAVLILSIVTMLSGQYQLSATDVWRVLTSPSEPVEGLVVLGLRLPRLVTAMLVGMALGGAGAIFQSIARNPLASPDIVGFTTGSASGALAVILVAGQSGAAIASGAILGGFVTALLVYLIALDRGIVGQKLIMVGIAISAMLASVNDFLLTRAELERAQVAKTWLFGSLHATGWTTAWIVALGSALLLPLALTLSGRLRMLEMGDDLASALGVPLKHTKIALLAIGVGLTALAIAGAGPIGFVALAAPQLARRLTRSAGIAIPSSAVMGCLLVVGADLLAQRLLAPLQLPVGLITGALGGIYLATLLAREWRKTDRP